MTSFVWEIDFFQIFLRQSVRGILLGLCHDAFHSLMRKGAWMKIMLDSSHVHFPYHLLASLF